jgi:hypothetical protein
LLACDDLLTKHTFLESQKSGINLNLKSVNRRAQQFTRTGTNVNNSSNNTSGTSSVSIGSKKATSSSSSLVLSPNSSNATNDSFKPASMTSTLSINESQLVKEKLDALNKAFELINELGAERRKFLEEHRVLHKFVEEADEEWMWLQEKMHIVKMNTVADGQDLSSIQMLINKHEQLEDELKFRKARIDEKVNKINK